MSYNWKRLPKTRRKVIKKTVKTFGGVCLFYVPISFYWLVQFGGSNRSMLIAIVFIGILLLLGIEKTVVEDLRQEERDFIFQSYSKIVRANMDPLTCSTPQVEQRVQELLEVGNDAFREMSNRLDLWDFDEKNEVFLEDFRNALYRS